MENTAGDSLSHPTQQLQNERQDSTDGPQGDVLPYTPDLNHNGIAERAFAALTINSVFP